jgi:hypothetical protein
VVVSVEEVNQCVGVRRDTHGRAMVNRLVSCVITEVFGADLGDVLVRVENGDASPFVGTFDGDEFVADERCECLGFLVCEVVIWFELVFVIDGEIIPEVVVGGRKWVCHAVGWGPSGADVERVCAVVLVWFSVVEILV